MIKYAKKIVLKKTLFQKQFLSNIKIRKDIKNLFKLHFKTIEHSLSSL
jgi:hypothetical protein